MTLFVDKKTKKDRRDRQRRLSFDTFRSYNISVLAPSILTFAVQAPSDQMSDQNKRERMMISVIHIVDTQIPIGPNLY